MPPAACPPLPQASVRVRATQDNVAGVKLPRFESIKEAGDGKAGLIGLGTGGKQIQECRCVCVCVGGQVGVGRMRREWCVRRGGRGPPCLGCCPNSLPPLRPLPPITRSPSPPVPRAPPHHRKSFMAAVDLLVELASLQTAFLTLDEAIKTTNRRVNALEHVVKPRLENTIAYIKVRGGVLGVGGCVVPMGC